MYILWQNKMTLMRSHRNITIVTYIRHIRYRDMKVDKLKRYVLPLAKIMGGYRAQDA